MGDKIRAKMKAIMGTKMGGKKRAKMGVNGSITILSSSMVAKGILAPSTRAAWVCMTPSRCPTMYVYLSSDPSAGVGVPIITISHIEATRGISHFIILSSEISNGFTGITVYMFPL